MGEREKIKCVVWDLDNTLWTGTLLEDSEVKLNTKAAELMKHFDEIGILNSIASKNDKMIAWKRIKEWELDEYILYPQISWQPKSESIIKIAEKLNINRNAIAFIDDQEFERMEVQSVCPEVLCLSPDRLDEIPSMPAFCPLFITDDSKQRRKMYQSDMLRVDAEECFQGPETEFLRQLNMKFSISKATEADLKRVEELTVRTHQLNTTGYTYSYDELRQFIEMDEYQLYIAGLDDRFGSYGKIGLCLLHIGDKEWNIKLFLLSCRIVSRGVGFVFLQYMIQLAAQDQSKLSAEFKHNSVNRMMYMTYKFLGFTKSREENGVEILEYNPGFNKLTYPDYLELIISD